MPQVSYELEDGTKVGFDINPDDSWQPVGFEEVVGKLDAAVAPAVAGARAILTNLKEIQSNQIEVKFGIKVSGSANWVIAKGGAEGNFEVTLTWQRSKSTDDG